MRAARLCWIAAGCAALGQPAVAAPGPADEPVDATAPAGAAGAPNGSVAPDASRAPDASPAVDLRVHHQPPKLRMRTAAAAKAEPRKAAAGEGGGGEPVATTFTALPRSTRDLAERFTFRLRAGLQLDNAPASGDALRGGAPLPPGFSGSRPWVVGDAMVGARDILLPSLGGYFLSSFQFDTNDSLATRSAVITPGDAADQRLAIKAGYVEYGNDDRQPQKLWLRGGRQFRLDGGAMFAYFDGITVGYRTSGGQLSGFVGQRVVLYVNSEAGVTFGATAAADLQALRGIPVKLAVDYMGLAINQTDMATRTSETQLRQLLSITGSYEPSKQLRLDARARIVDAGGGGNLGLGQIGGRLKYAASDRIMVIGDVEQRQGGDLAYDLAAPSAVDVIDVARKLGVGVGAPINALTVGAHLDYRTGPTEILVFGRAELPEDTPVAVDQQGWFEVGAAVAGRVSSSGWLTAQYTGRIYQLQADANLMGAPFGDTAGSGLDKLHELSVEATLHSSQRWRVGVGAFYRIYDLVSPYRTADNDGRGGGRADLMWWFTRTLHAAVAAEVAQPSAVLAREIGTMSSVRGILEAQW